MAPFEHIRFAGKSDIGRRRKNNEDSYGVFPACGVFCVADGMGGGDDGEIASAATVCAVKDFCGAHPLPSGKCWDRGEWLDGICGSVCEASNWIFNRTKGKGLKGCGSTFVGVCLDPSRPNAAMALHAGDSRLYLWHRGVFGRSSLRQVTRDHSAAELIGAKDEQSISRALRGMIMRAVGVQPTVEIERTPFRLSPGDRILLCSDGLTKMLSDQAIAEFLQRHSPPDETVEALIAAANEAGGVDNVSVVVVDVDTIPDELPSVGMGEIAPQFAVDDDPDTEEEPCTMATGVEFPVMVSSDSDSTPPITSRTPATYGDARRRFVRPWWVPLQIAFGCVLLGAIIGGAVYLAMRRESVRKSVEMAREEQMARAVEEVKREQLEKDRQRMAEERNLKQIDDAKAKQDRAEEQRQIEGNVDLPRE